MKTPEQRIELLELNNKILLNALKEVRSDFIRISKHEYLNIRDAVNDIDKAILAATTNPEGYSPPKDWRKL